MRVIFSVSLFFFFFVQNSFGQVEPRLYQQSTSIAYAQEGDFQKLTESTYEYNELGDYTSIVSKSYNDQEELVNWTGDFYIYNNENLLIKQMRRRYNSDVDLWITTSWNEYEYNTNGCLVFDKVILNVGGFFSEMEYERNADCQMTKEVYWRKAVGTDTLALQHVLERTYFQDGSSYREVRLEPKVFLNNDLIIKKISDVYFYPNGNLDEVYTTFNDNTGAYKYDGKYTYVYDQFDNRISNTLHRQDSIITDWTLLNVHSYDLEYDEDNRMIGRKSGFEDYTFDPPQIQEGSGEDFEYWCKDLIKVNTADIGNGFLIYKFESFYEGENECFELEKELLEMSVFPNPTTGIINIESPIFGSGHTQISVFDMNGKLLLGKKEWKVSIQSEIDLSDLPNGIYVVQLLNQDYAIQQKVVLTK